LKFIQDNLWNDSNCAPPDIKKNVFSSIRVSTTGKSQGKPGKVREKYYFWKSQGKQGENALDREKSGKFFMN